MRAARVQLKVSNSTASVLLKKVGKDHDWQKKQRLLKDAN